MNFKNFFKRVLVCMIVMVGMVSNTGLSASAVDGDNSLLEQYGIDYQPEEAEPGSMYIGTEVKQEGTDTLVIVDSYVDEPSVDGGMSTYSLLVRNDVKPGETRNFTQVVNYVHIPTAQFIMTGVISVNITAKIDGLYQTSVDASGFTSSTGWRIQGGDAYTKSLTTTRLYKVGHTANVTFPSIIYSKGANTTITSVKMLTELTKINSGSWNLANYIL
jgi:hypothetical protein